MKPFVIMGATFLLACNSVVKAPGKTTIDTVAAVKQFEDFINKRAPHGIPYTTNLTGYDSAKNIIDFEQYPVVKSTDTGQYAIKGLPYFFKYYPDKNFAINTVTFDTIK